MKKKYSRHTVKKSQSILKSAAYALLSFLTLIGDTIRAIPGFIVSVCAGLGSIILKTKFFVNILHDIGHMTLSLLTPLIKLPKTIAVRVKKKLSTVKPIAFPTLSLPRRPFRKKSAGSDVRKPAVKSSVLYQRPKVSVRLPSRQSFHQAKIFAYGIIVTILFFFIPYVVYQWLDALPSPKLLTRRDLEVSTKIFDRNGQLLYEFYTDQNRTPIPFAEIPKSIKDATVAIEDRDFYRHSGFSVKGMVRAVREISVKGQVQGGSTITQQLIKSALLSPEIKLSRKVKEIVLAFWAERMYSKEQILEMYLNQVPYGGTSWGIESASQTYFGKSVKDLTLAESALLAGLPAAPTEYSPFGTHPEKAFQRQAEVLRRMVEDKYITKDEAEKAFAQPVHFVAPRVAIRAPHFVMYVKDLLEKKYGPRLVEHGGLRVVTSLDVGIQEKAQDIVSQQIAGLARLNVGNGASVVTNPKTGEILAMVGSKNYFDIASEGNVNLTTSIRQPGSSIKVVTYALALENGFTPASIIDDSPVVYSIPGSVPYAPVNYDSRFHGPTPLRYALANSYNIPAVKLAAKLGVPAIVDKGRMMGIDSWIDDSRYGLSITLGAAEVTMLDMAKVFGTLGNEGRRVDLMPVLEVTDYTGKVNEKNKPARGIQAVKPEVAWLMGNMLADNTARTSAFGPNSALVVQGKTVSVKTGTSNDKRDNWTIGYTPSYVVTTWVGNNNNAPMNPYLASGITGAAPIWHDIFVELLKDKQDEPSPRPPNVLSISCYFNRPEFFIKGTEPTGGKCAALPTPNPSGSPTPSKNP